MGHTELERELKMRMRKGRIIEAILCAAFLAMIIGFSVARERSKVVTEIGWGPISHQSVTYNESFQWGIIVGVLGLIICTIYLIGDFVFSKLNTVEVNGDYITLYRGALHTNLYVNGEYKDGLAVGYHLEASLSDKSKVNVALGKWSAHLTFTNGHSPIDV